MPDSHAPAPGLVPTAPTPSFSACSGPPALGYVRVGEVGSYVALFPHGRPGPKLLLQRVAEPKVAKNRVHLDIEVPDIEAEAGRLVGLGASRRRDSTHNERGTTWVLMADLEGNESCVCDAGHPAS
jgi:predicted enzyme related to lactoylglutathione lyase